MSLMDQRPSGEHDRLHLENWPSPNGDVAAAAEEQEKRLNRSFSMPTSSSRETERKEVHGVVVGGESKMPHEEEDRRDGLDRVDDVVIGDPSVQDIQRALKQNFVNTGVIDDVTVNMIQQEKQPTCQVCMKKPTAPRTK